MDGSSLGNHMMRGLVWLLVAAVLVGACGSLAITHACSTYRVRIERVQNDAGKETP